ncbi:MAG: hypothetical protein AAFN05_14500, partial [Pseudomonadota bacterium]
LDWPDPKLVDRPARDFAAHGLASACGLLSYGAARFSQATRRPDWITVGSLAGPGSGSSDRMTTMDRT